MTKIEGLRPPKFRAVIFVFFISIFKLSLFLALPASTLQVNTVKLVFSTKFDNTWDHLYLNPHLIIPCNPLILACQSRCNSWTHLNLSDSSGTHGICPTVLAHTEFVRQVWHTGCSNSFLGVFLSRLFCNTWLCPAFFSSARPAYLEESDALFKIHRVSSNKSGRQAVDVK